MARGWNDAGGIAQNAIRPAEADGPPAPTSREIEAMQRAKYTGPDAARVAPGMSLVMPPSDAAPVSAGLSPPSSTVPSASDSFAEIDAQTNRDGTADINPGLVPPTASSKNIPQPDVAPMPPRRPSGSVPAPPLPAPIDVNNTSARPVAATPQSFEDSFRRTLGFEGGYSPSDANGYEVNKGINAEWHPDVDIKNLTDDQARAIYKNEYWDAIGADNLDPKIRGMAFDTAVIAGPAKAKELLSQSGGDPQKFMELRSAFQNDLVNSNPEKYGRFAKAWDNRNAALAGGEPPRTGLAMADTGTQNDAGFLSGLGGAGKTISDIGGSVADAAKGTGNWFSSNQNWLVPLLTGIGTMASSPSRYLGSAVLQGLGGGAQAYTQQQRLMNEQNRLGLSTLQNYQSQFQPMYAADNKTVTGYMYKPTATPMSVEQYNKTLSDARANLMPSFRSEAFAPATGATGVPSAPTTARQPLGSSSAPTTAPQPLGSSSAQPTTLTATATEEKYPKDTRGLPALVSGDADSYRARINAVTTLASNMSPDNPNKIALLEEAKALVPEELRIRGEGAARATEAKGQRDTAFLNSSQNFLTQYDQNKQAIKETADNYRHYQSGPFAERTKEAGALTGALGIPWGANEVTGYDTAQKSAATDALLSKNLYGMSGAPATGAEMGLSATHSPEKAPAANYKILTDKDAALDYQKDMIDGFKASGSKDFDNYINTFQQTHHLEDYVARSRMKMAPFAGTNDTLLKTSGIERPALVGSDTSPGSLVDGKYYTNGGRLLRWDAKRNGFVEPFGGQ